MDSYNYVLKKYLFDNRHYHDINHINKMLRDSFIYGDPKYTMDGHGFLNPNLYDAILFHDYVYDTSPDKVFSNEYRSAIEYQDFHTKYEKTTDRHQVMDMINATEHHFDGTEYTDYLVNFILDMDLMGFLDPYEKFKDTQILIDAEYSKWYDPELVQEKRIEFLQDILDNKKLRYRVLSEADKRAEWAYTNIKELLKDLQK